MNIRFPQRMRINGTYLEDTVPGYHTLEVTGRDSIEMDIDSVSFARVDGERYQGKRATVRTLTVRFVIEGYGPSDFASKLAKLKTALKVTEAQLIFDDEPDKYWIGTPSKLEPEQVGPSACQGKIEITCSDPYKYGLVERSVDFVDGTAEIYYGGTEEQAPVFHVLNNAANGFISFSSGDDSIIFGDDTDDGTTPADPDAMIEYVANRDGLPEAGSTWAYNAGILPYPGAAASATGTMALTTWTPTNLRLYASGFGTDNNAWHGPAIQYNLAGSKTDWSITVYHRQGATANTQRGVFQIALNSADGNVASCRFDKSTTGSMDAGALIFVGGVIKKTVGFQMTANNPITGPGVTTITKTGGTITFSFNGASYQFTDASLASVAVTNIVLFIAKWKATDFINTSYITGFRFTSKDESVEVHSFWPGDTLDVDCGSASVKYNDSPTPSLGRLRNPWEAFKLKPGLNVITMSASDWTETPPTGKVTYREVFT